MNPISLKNKKELGRWRLFVDLLYALRHVVEKAFEKKEGMNAAFMSLEKTNYENDFISFDPL